MRLRRTETLGTIALLISLTGSRAYAFEVCDVRPVPLQCTSFARTFVEHIDRRDSAKDVNRMLAGDLNGDGRVDLVFSAVAGGVFAILADERGAYGAEPRPISSDQLLPGALTDADDDGTLDVVAHAYPDKDAQLAIFANDGLANFRPVLSQVLPNLERVGAILAEDLNGDHHKELVVLGSRLRDERTEESGSVEIYARAGDGFVLGEQVPCGIANAIALGDVDADGSIDIVLETSRDDDFAPNPQSTLSFYRNDGTGKFSPVSEFAVPLLGVADANRPMRLVDLDRNGTLDILSAPRTSEDVALVSNLGGGSFGAVERIRVGEAIRNSYEVEATDLDLDGDLDLLARTSRWASLVIRAEHEEWAERGSIDLWSGSRTSPFYAMAVFDLNADQYPDFVALTADSTLSRWISEPSPNKREAELDGHGCTCSAGRPIRVSSSLYSFALWLSAGWLVCRRRTAAVSVSQRRAA